MIFELILLLLVLYFITSNNYQTTKLDELNKKAYEIIKKAEVNPIPIFTLYETQDYPHTYNRKEIYIVIKNKKGEYYDENTLIGVLCHEIAHILSGIGDEHGEVFEKWEDDLLAAANNLGFYDSQIGVNDEYPCYHQ